MSSFTDRTKSGAGRGRAKRLAVVLGDQLDREAPTVQSLGPDDAVLMMEVKAESTSPPSHRRRTAMFLSAMRSFALDLVERGARVRYIALDDPANTQTFEGEIARAIGELRPEELVCLRPGAWRVQRLVQDAAASARIGCEIVEDPHFLTSVAEFAAWRGARKKPVMEHFYRWQRKRLGVLVDSDGKPEGDAWNYDADNRESFSKGGPGLALRPPERFEATEETREVVAMLERALPDLPGEPFDAADLGWPTTPEHARLALRDFVKHRLEKFGPFEDAMWTGEPWLYHSRLSPALNLKLLDPRECVRAAVDAYEKGRAPLQSVEGFVRQIIGWREFVRGVYWTEAPDYEDRNALGHGRPLPEVYWNGETDMRCMRECIGQVLEHGYGHHIQRLMVTGAFALLTGVRPKTVSDWYLGMYVDGVDWATVPNTVGMSQFADGGVVGTKPYAASGRYVERMSDYCRGCRYDPGKRTGEDACPMTTLFWGFLLHHEEAFRANPRMKMMLKHVEAMGKAERVAITASAKGLRDRIAPTPPASRIEP